MSLPPEFQTFTGPKDANFIDNNNNKAAFNLVKFSARMDRTYDTAPTKGSISNHRSKNEQRNLEPTTKDNNLSYPMNVGESDQQQQGHYIMFSILESGHGKISKAANKKIAGIENQSNVQGTAQSLYQEGAAGKAKYARGGKHRITKVSNDWTKLKQAITLYMPPSVRVQYKTDYDDTPISSRAVASVGAIEAFTQNEASGIGVFLSAQAWKDAAASVGEGVKISALNLAKGAADTFAPGAGALAQISSGAVIGNKMELLFKGVGRRDFQYEFTFVPKSAAEAAVIAKIVYAFKINMLPEYKEGKVFGKNLDLAKSGGILTIPNAFDISYMYIGEENPWINKISSCYLTNMDVEYGGEKFVSYPPMEEPISGKKGPPPQRTKVSLSFSEIEILTRESVDEVGF